MKTAETRPLTALRHYPVQKPLILDRDEVGIINDNWLVTDGAGQRYMLRAYRRVRDTNRIAFQLAFQEHLFAAGFPTAPVVRTRDGETSAFVEGLHWALFGFVEGQVYDFGRTVQAREAGKRLAQFEAVAATFAGTVVAPPTESVNSGNWLAPVSSHVWRTSALSDEHEKRLRELYAESDFQDDLGFFSRWRREALEEWPPERLAALPRSWLHCDYHGRNMVFEDDELVGLFDFDFITQGPRTYDIGRALFNFGRERPGSTVLREEFCRAFLEGYESEQPLTADERAALPFMTVFNWVPDAAFNSARNLEPGDSGLGSRLHTDVRMMQAMQAEMRRLGPRLGWDVS